MDTTIIYAVASMACFVYAHLFTSQQSPNDKKSYIDFCCHEKRQTNRKAMTMLSKLFVWFQHTQIIKKYIFNKPMN